MPKQRKNYDKAVLMYVKGFSIQECASYYGITRQAMWKILKRRNVIFRDNIKTGSDNPFYRGGSKREKVIGSVMAHAVKKGIIIKKPCEKCGSEENVQAHHDDYNKPLDIRWLCKKCHYEWHKHNTAKELCIEIPRMSKEKICSLGGKTCWSKNRKASLENLRKARDSRKIK